jgi:hypothetical protein
MQKFMSSEEFSLAMFEAKTNYADISAFFGSDRRTGHRWQEDGPSNQVARLVQLMCALGLSLDDVRVLISRGVEKSGGAVPNRVAALETQVAALRQETAKQAGKPILIVKDQGRARAPARGGKGTSDGNRSTHRAPKARQPSPATLR